MNEDQPADFEAAARELLGEIERPALALVQGVKGRVGLLRKLAAAQEGMGDLSNAAARRLRDVARLVDQFDAALDQLETALRMADPRKEETPCEKQ